MRFFLAFPALTFALILIQPGWPVDMGTRLLAALFGAVITGCGVVAFLLWLFLLTRVLALIDRTEPDAEHTASDSTFAEFLRSRRKALLMLIAVIWWFLMVIIAAAFFKAAFVKTLDWPKLALALIIAAVIAYVVSMAVIFWGYRGNRRERLTEAGHDPSDALNRNSEKRVP